MRWVPVFLVSLMLVAAFVPCLLVMAQPSLTPHEDPSAIHSTLDPFSFLTQYAQIFTLISTKDYLNASRLSEEMSLITVPADLAYIINRYNNLTQQFIGVLSDLQSTLDNASTLLNQYRLDEAGQVLDHAGVLVAQAKILLGELQDATLALNQQFGVFASSAESRVQQAYNELQSILQKLNDLINQYHTLLDTAKQRAQYIISQDLEPTTLSLVLDSTKSFVGSYVEASGFLTSNGQVLGDRAVQLLLDGQQAGTADTRSDGSYSLKVQIPFNYVDYVSVSALYTPAGGDRGVYLASLSPTVKVQVLFYRTILNVSVSGFGYPGLPLSFNGKVASEDGSSLDGRRVNVMLDGVSMVQVVSDQNGFFSSMFTIDSAAKLGIHSLTMSVGSSGLYAGASFQRTLNIEQRITVMKVNAPSLVVLPSQLQVTGVVGSASGPLKGASVLVQAANVSGNAKTSADGSFSLTIDLPLTSFLAGYQYLTVQAQPSEPWQAAGQARVSVFLLNSVSVGVALASSLSVVFVGYFRLAGRRGRKEKERVEATATSTITAPKGGKAVFLTPELKFEDGKGAVVKAYSEALRAVQASTGEYMKPSMTLREYLQAVSLRIGKAGVAFSELTTLMERSLYSPYEPQQKDLQKAKSWVDEVGRLLSGGSA